MNQETNFTKTVAQYLALNRLNDALKEVRKKQEESQSFALSDRLEKLESDYSLFITYYAKGYKDPEREAIFSALKQKTYVLAVDAATMEDYRKKPFLTFSSNVFKASELSLEEIQQQEEAFLNAETTLQMQLDEGDEARLRKLLQEHRRTEELVFHYFASLQSVSPSLKERIKALLLGAFMERRDVLLALSAMTLACLNHYDLEKIRLFQDIYLEAEDEAMRQRALVALLLSLVLCPEIYRDSQAEILASLLKDNDFKQDFYQAQRQMIITACAQKDKQEIQRDIMPKIIEASRTQLRSFGLEESDEDFLQDISGDQEAKMDEANDKIQRMMDMQKAGSDVYFGGFQQMKRLPFYSNLINWFVPFYVSHPDLQGLRQCFEENPFFEKLLLNNPFCDCDKYSFALTLKSMLTQMPDTLKKAMSQGSFGDAMFDNGAFGGDAYGDGAFDNGAKRDASHAIRLGYLQDLYRFFELSKFAAGLPNPFVPGSMLFAPCAKRLDIKEVNSLASLLYHKRFLAQMSQLLDGYTNDTSELNMLLHGIERLKYRQQPKEAIGFLERCVLINPDNEQALRLLALCFRLTKQHSKAVDIYDTLSKRHPEDNRYDLQRSVALIDAKRYEEASQLLYRLNYNTPDEPKTMRILAWSLLCQSKTDAAGAMYQKLLISDKCTAADFLNGAYCQWFKGDIGQASALLKTYLERTTGNAPDKWSSRLERDFKNDDEILTLNGVTATERSWMIDAVALSNGD